MSSQHKHTLFHIVSSIKLQKFKLTRSKTPDTDEEECTPCKFWTIQEQRLFFNILKSYGADFSILKHHFPKKSRNQIKKKCTEFELKRGKALEKYQQRKARQQRKGFFDREVMNIDNFKWRNSKPNKPESIIESD